MSLQRLAVMVMSLFLAVPAMAEVYRYVDDKGNLVLTDTPPKDKAVVDKMEKLESRPVMTVPAFKPKGQPGKRPGESDSVKKEQVGYTIIIQSPEQGAFFQRNGGEAIPVAVSVSPSLPERHRLAYFVDGKEQRGEIGALQPEELDRGTHRLEVRVLDPEGVVLTSNAVEFNIQQSSAKGKAK